MAGTIVISARNRIKSPFQECFDILGEAHNEDVYGAIERLVQAGEEVGFMVHDLVRVLKGGMSLEALLDLIEVRMEATCIHAVSNAA